MSEQFEDGRKHTNVTTILKSVDKDLLACRKKGSIKEYFSARSNESKTKTTSKSIQVNLDKWISENDLSFDDPAENYWKVVAENRRKALSESLTENKKLHTQLSQLKEQNSTLKESLNEVNSFIEVFQEIMSNSDGTDTAAANVHNTKNCNGTVENGIEPSIE